MPRGRYGSLTAAARPASRTGPPTVSGRWSLLPAAEPEPTHRAHALARTLLDRHGVVTRGAVQAEGVEGGFSAVYRVLAAFEDSGQARRGYVVEGLGAAQFAMDGAVDRLRAASTARDRAEPGSAPRALVLAAADPANAYGAALPWPESPDGAGHKPGRKAGALVVLVDGELTLYMERGGKSLLAWPTDPDDPALRAAAEALASAARAGSARHGHGGAHQRRLLPHLAAGPHPGGRPASSPRHEACACAPERRLRRRAAGTPRRRPHRAAHHGRMPEGDTVLQTAHRLRRGARRPGPDGRPTCASPGSPQPT